MSIPSSQSAELARGEHEDSRSKAMQMSSGVSEASPSKHTGSTDTFPWTDLPLELQRHVIEYALAARNNLSPTSLLLSNRAVLEIAAPVLYEHVRLTSIIQATLLVEGRQRQRKRSIFVKDFDDASSIADAIAGLDLKQSETDDAGLISHAKTFTFTQPGVPGGSIRGGRASALSSPERREQARQDGKSSALEPSLSNRRLLIAAQAMLLCPTVEHCAISMFGVRHSTLLTSMDYLAEEASAFRNALAQMQRLRSFSWGTPRENDNFVGFSVAVVDIAIPPLIEGLQTAAIDMQPDGRRRKLERGSLSRFAHPLQHVALHHAILPMSSDPRNSIFYLFAQVHPDDEDWALFPCMQRIHIRTAVDIAPGDVAYLSLCWQLRLDPAVQDDLSDVEHHQLRLATSSASGQYDPVLELSDVFVHSIWGPRVTMDAVREALEAFVASSGPACDESEGSDARVLSSAEDDSTESASPATTNPYIRALNESTDTDLRLSERHKRRLRKLTTKERQVLLERALARVHVSAVEGAIAGV